MGPRKASYGLRVFIALTAAVAVCWQFDALTALPGVFLGIIASAIAETDDNWWGRIKAVVLSLLCFCIAAASVIWLFPWPWIFIGALALSTFGLTLLGALGERYASIAQATVTLAIYTMIGLSSMAPATCTARWTRSAICWPVQPGTGCCRSCGLRCSPTGRCANAWRGCTLSWAATCS